WLLLGGRSIDIPSFGLEISNRRIAGMGAVAAGAGFQQDRSTPYRPASSRVDLHQDVVGHRSRNSQRKVVVRIVAMVIVAGYQDERLQLVQCTQVLPVPVVIGYLDILQFGEISVPVGFQAAEPKGRIPDASSVVARTDV